MDRGFTVLTSANKLNNLSPVINNQVAIMNSILSNILSTILFCSLKRFLNVAPLSVKTKRMTNEKCVTGLRIAVLLCVDPECHYEQTLPDRARTRPVFSDIHNPSNMTFHWWIIGVSCFALTKGTCIWRTAIFGNSIEA
jgi:hypothetical protein